MATSSQSKGWSLWRNILFFVSLGLNVLVIGVLVGAIAFGGRPGPRAAIDGPFPMLRALAEPERQQVLQIVRAERSSQSERPVKSLRRGRKLLDLIRAEDFDSERFTALVEAQTKAAAGRSEAGLAALTTVLAEMSLADRRAFATRLEEMLRRSARDRPKPTDRSRPDAPR